MKTRWNPKFGLSDLKNDLLTSTTSEGAQWFFSRPDILILQQFKVPSWAVEKQYYEMPEFVGFQTMVILDPYGMTFDASGIFGLAF